MGCTQSKAAKDAVVISHGAQKQVATGKPTDVVSPRASVQPSVAAAGGEDLAASHTVSSDDNEVPVGDSKDSTGTASTGNHVNNNDHQGESTKDNKADDNEKETTVSTPDDQITTIMPCETTVPFSESIEITTSATNVTLGGGIDSPTAEFAPTDPLDNRTSEIALSESRSSSAVIKEEIMAVEEDDKKEQCPQGTSTQDFKEPESQNELPDEINEVTVEQPALTRKLSGEAVLIEEKISEIETVAVLDDKEKAAETAVADAPPVDDIDLDNAVPLDHCESTIEVVALDEEKFSRGLSFNDDGDMKDIDDVQQNGDNLEEEEGNMLDYPAPDGKLAIVQNSSPSKQIKFCAGCFAEESNGALFKVCAKCKSVSYCSRECQVQHWKIHKKGCCKEVQSGTLDLREFSPDKNGNFVETTVRKSTSHEDAVRELEAVLRRLRSEESQTEEEHQTFEIVALDQDELLGKTTNEDPVETAREAVLENTTVSEMLDSGIFDVAEDNPSPLKSPPPKLPVVEDENTPILQVPQVRTCAGCSSVEKAHGAFKCCAKCRVVFYCNRKCQKSHWKEHKKTCCKSDPTGKKNNNNLLLQAKDASLNSIKAS